MDDPEPERWCAEHLEMHLELASDRVLVATSTRVRRQGAHSEPLVLDGRGLETLAVEVDGQALPTDRYALDARSLTIPLDADEHVVRTVVAVRPGGPADKGLGVRPRLISTNC